MSAIETAFTDCSGGAETVNRATVYDILCLAGHNPTPLDIAHYYKQHGKQDDDCLTLEECQELSSDLGDPVEVMKKAFKYFDTNGDNTIDREELKQILKSTDVYGCEIHLDEDYVDQTLRLGDKNGDGKLDIDELIQMINSNLLST